MPLSLLYFTVRQLLGLLTAGDHDDAAREIEILVLRDKLRVLSRGRGPLKRCDRILPAAASWLLPRELWHMLPGLSADGAALVPRPREAQVDLPTQAATG